ncbi:MAG: hypothetical protein GX642_14340 [Smithella sp.]|nr:hypothetical protein [Smithella sp.]
MKDKLYDLTGLDSRKRTEASKYYARLTESERIESIRLAFDLSKQHLSKADDDIRGGPEFFFSMLCLSSWKMRWVREALSKKNKALTEKQVLEVSERRLESILSARRDRIKRGRLAALVEVRLYHVIDSLRSQNLSWRECAMYLKRYHKTSISHVHLREIFLKIKSENKIRGGS